MPQLSASSSKRASQKTIPPTRLAPFLVAAFFLALVSRSADAERLFALVQLPGEAGYQVVGFDSSSPSVLESEVQVNITFPTGGGSLSDLVAAPLTGELFAASSSCPVFPVCQAGLVGVDPGTGLVAPTQLSLPFTFPFFPADSWSLDVDPLAPELRVFDTASSNYRFDFDSGALLGEETPLSLGFTVAGIAYTPASNGATLYGVGTMGGVDQLVRIGGVGGNPSPNTGQVTAIGPLGYSLGEAGLEITASGKGFTIVRVESSGLGVSIEQLAEVNFDNGSVTLLGPVGDGHTVVGLAAAVNGMPASVAIPTLESWGLLSLVLLLALVGVRRLR
jgi:Domain of unknown function (DUF4394)/IPTL-CTERM motif